MNILVVTSSIPRFPGDISGKFVREHCDLLRAAGHTVRVLAWSDPHAVDPNVEWIDYTDGRGIFFGAGAPENLEASPGLLAQVPRAFARMLEHVLDESSWADLLVGHWLVPSGIVVRLAGWLESKPSLVVCHSGGVHLVARLPRSIRRFAPLLAGPMTVSSAALAQKLATFGLEASVLPMGIPARDLSSNQSNDWLIMSRLAPIKGIDLAVRAFALADLDATLHIAGDGPERERLEELAGSLDARVVFHGWTTGEAKSVLLNRSRFALMPSKIENERFEGFPTGLLELQLAGLIPLVSDSPGLAEAVFDRNLVVDGRSVEEWARRIRLVARGSYEARLAHQFASQFTWESLEPAWLAQIAHASRRCRSASF